MNNKVLKNLIVTSLAVGLVNFSPIILSENSYQIVSVAYAAVENVTASNSAIFDFGEDDPQIVETVKNVAKMRAIQSAKEKAGVYVKSFSKTVDGILTDDDISAYTSNNITVVDVQYKKIPVQTHDVQGNDIGKIAYMYEATVTAKIDTSGLQNYIRRDEKEKITIVQQNKDSQKNVEKIANDFDNLRNSSGNKTSEQIKSEVQKIDNEVLAQQKFDEGNGLYYKGDFKGAISKYNEIIEWNPNYANIYYNRGVAYDSLENYSQAISDYEQAIKLNPNFVDAYYNRGRAYYELKNYVQSIQNYTQVIKLNPNDSSAYNSIGAIYYNLQDYSKAIENYTKSIQLNPNFSKAYYNRGTAYGILQNYLLAVSDFSKAIQLNPNNSVYYYDIGVAYAHLQNYEQSINNCNKAIKLNSNYASAYQLRGFCYQALGENAKAEADFAKAKELGFNG